jgi:hypothetical protein
MLSAIVGPLSWAVGDGTAVAATTTKTSLLTGVAATGKWDMPGGYFTAPGQMLRISASGRISTPAATQGNITFTLAVGAVNACVSPTFVSLASQTNIAWQLYWLITCRAVGDGALTTLMHTGNLETALVSATNTNNLIPPTAPVVGTGFNTNTAANVDLHVTWSNATAGNTIQLHQYLLESVV